MAALLVALNILAVLLSVAMPLWKTAVQRDKEAELIWRGSQYARAIALFQRKYANAYPPNLDILLNERFLRKKYKDPVTKDGEFQLVYFATPSSDGRQNVPAGQRPVPAGQQPGTTAPQGPSGARGGIMGVVSKSTETSLRLFNGRSKYNEWAFTPQTVLGIPPPGAGGNRPGANVPGSARPGMPNQPGGQMPGPGGQRALPPGFPRVPGQGQQPPRPFGLPQRPPG
jgi:type II secretory pathway pseudopilin PulG